MTSVTLLSGRSPILPGLHDLPDVAALEKRYALRDDRRPLF